MFPTEVTEVPLVAHDAVAGGCYVSLLAPEEHPELLAHHHALDDGVPAAHRRRDIPFAPHITVGRRDHVGECRRISNQLNEERRPVRARINNVDIAEVKESMGPCGN